MSQVDLGLVTWNDDAYQEQPPLWNHQADGVPELLRGSYALFWEPRLGKTRACGEAIRILDAQRAIDGVLILPPVNAKDVWSHALDLFCPDWPVFMCEGLQGQPIPLEYKAIICNPDILQSQVKGTAAFGGWTKYLVDWMARRRMVVIQDETHLFFTNPYSKRYKAASTLTRLAERVWILSGTPMEKSGLDVHWQMKQLGPRYPFYLASTDQFGKRFCHSKSNPFKGTPISGTTKAGKAYTRMSGGYDYGLFKDPEGFWRDVLGSADRRMRKDCLDVPATRRMDIWIDTVNQSMNPKDWAKDRIDLLPRKVEQTIAYVKDLLEQGEGPIVVGAHHRLFTETLARRLGAPAVIGGIPSDKRAHIYNEFQQGKHPIIVGNFRAMGVAIELTRSCHAVAGELTWVARDLRQWEDRLQGDKQKHEVLVHYLLVRGSYEEIVWNRVLMKGRGMDDLDEAARRLRELEDSGLAMEEMES